VSDPDAAAGRARATRSRVHQASQRWNDSTATTKLATAPSIPPSSNWNNTCHRYQPYETRPQYPSGANLIQASDRVNSRTAATTVTMVPTIIQSSVSVTGANVTAARTDTPRRPRTGEAFHPEHRTQAAMVAPASRGNRFEAVER
jgi:hypothetical protein